jgi:(4S)-4-hydroxy-5-phosphonooxypentane-2,3-dione isomerase
MSKVSVVAKLTVKPDKIDDFPAAWDDLLAHVDANEPGTEHYVLHQSSTEPNVFYVTEVYADQAALDAHMGSDVFAAFGGGLADYVDGGDMQILAPVKAAKGAL